MRPARNGYRPRRVAGLRREEAAGLAAISVDYYTRLEQGRVRASATVLTTLAQTLRPDDDQRRYLHELADRSDTRPPLLLHGGGPATIAGLGAHLATLAHTITPVHPSWSGTPRPHGAPGPATSPAPTSITSVAEGCGTSSS